MHDNSATLESFMLKNNSQIRLIVTPATDPSWPKQAAKTTVSGSPDDADSSDPNLVNKVFGSSGSKIFYNLQLREDAEALVPLPPHKPPVELPKAKIEE